MRDIFYGIMCFCLIGILVVLYEEDKTLQESRHIGAVVIEKDNDYILGETMYLKYPNDSIDLECVYQIFYDKYNVGDTVKTD